MSGEQSSHLQAPPPGHSPRILEDSLESFSHQGQLNRETVRFYSRATKLLVESQVAVAKSYSTWVPVDLSVAHWVAVSGLSLSLGKGLQWFWLLGEL